MPKTSIEVRYSLRDIPPGIWALGFVSMLMDVSSEMIHALLPVYLVTVLGTSMVTVGFIEGIAEATASITKIFSGALSDWLGKRKLLAAIGYGLAAFTKPVFPLAPTVGWLVAARFIDRIGKGIRGAPRDALIADIAPAQSARRELRPAPVARYGRRVRRPATGDRPDVAGRRIISRPCSGSRCIPAFLSFGADRCSRCSEPDAGPKAARGAQIH